MGNPGESNGELQSLIADFLDADARGNAVDRAALMQKYPKHEDSLRQFFANHDRMQAGAKSAASSEPARVDGANATSGDTTRAYKDGDTTRALHASSESGEFPDKIGDYKILNVIAIHGQGIVYRANHPLLNRQVVIKLSKNSLDEHARQLVLEEGIALASLSHPNLVQIYDLQFEHEHPYLVMEYIEGRNLSERLKGKRLSVDDSISMMKKLTLALQHAHDRGIVHRDLKPANIVIRAVDNNPMVIDFGLARANSAYNHSDRDSVYGGTAAYMPPEQARQILEGPESKIVTNEGVDVFALGAILYELLTGRQLYSFENAHQGLQLAAQGEYDVSGLKDRSIPQHISAACLKALEPDVGKRFQSVAEFAAALSYRKRNLLRAVSYSVFAFITLSLMVVTVWRSINDPTKDSQASDIVETQTTPDEFMEPGTPKSADELLPGLRLIHFANETKTGIPGSIFRNGPVLEDDDLRIEVAFAVPKYCFLFALNPDGSEQLCYPEAPDLVQEMPIEGLLYPPNPDQGFALTDGPGQQAFVVVASDSPLPSFGEWWAELDEIHEANSRTQGQWLWHAGAARPWEARKTRGAPRELRGGEAFEDLFQQIEAKTSGDVLGVSFGVQPRRQTE